MSMVNMCTNSRETRKLPLKTYNARNSKFRLTLRSIPVCDVFVEISVTSNISNNFILNPRELFKGHISISKISCIYEIIVYLKMYSTYTKKSVHLRNKIGNIKLIYSSLLYMK